MGQERPAPKLFSNLLVMCASLIAITGIVEIALRIRTPEDIKSIRQPEQRATGDNCDKCIPRE